MELKNTKKEEVMEVEKARWNAIFKNIGKEAIRYDDWLEEFDKVICNCQTPIIDLGCGSGNDTLYLVEKGKKVVPCDYSSSAIFNIKKNFPEIEQVKCFDMRKGLPFEDNFTDIIISDLSLHYFSKQQTVEIIAEIKRVLKPNGLLLFRVNSVKDSNYGSGEGIERESHFYETEEGRYKRFFNAEEIEEFFMDWKTVYMNEETSTRYGLKKVLWKVAMQVNK